MPIVEDDVDVGLGDAAVEVKEFFVAFHAQLVSSAMDLLSLAHNRTGGHGLEMRIVVMTMYGHPTPGAKERKILKAIMTHTHHQTGPTRWTMTSPTPRSS